MSFYIETIGFDLKSLGVSKLGNDLFVTFSQFLDPFQQISSYAISDGIHTIVIGEKGNREWQILHCESMGQRDVFSEKYYPLLNKFKGALQSIHNKYNIKLTENALNFEEKEC